MLADKTMAPTSRRLPTRVAGILAAVLVLCCGCGRGAAKANAVRQELLDAINANDLSKVGSLLPPAGTPDLDLATYRAARSLAADRFAEVSGTSAARQRLPLIEELSRRYRHLAGVPVDVAGALSPGLTDNGGGHFTSGLMTLRSGDGIAHKVAISTQETEYTKNTSLDGQRLLVNFDATYKIQGVVIGKVIEAERVELVAAPDGSGMGSGNGMVMPVSPFLPSTEEIVLNHVDADRAARKTQ
jgi:hypothetical protein